MTRIESYLDKWFEKNYAADPRKSEKENKKLRDALYFKLYERAEHLFKSKGGKILRHQQSNLKSNLTSKKKDFIMKSEFLEKAIEKDY